MDNELHYLTYDPDAIWSEIMTSYINAGGDILYPGDEKEMLLRSVLADLVQAFAGVDNALRMQTLRYAVGSYLDIVGENRGCERLTGNVATATVKITTKNTGRIVTLPAGTTMTADGKVYYQFTSDVVTDGTVKEIITEISCIQSGSIGNGLVSGKSMTLSIANSNISAIITTSAASGGEDAETDDAYRERIRDYGLATVTTGPARQYENVAMSISSDIIDAKALSPSAGNVSVYLLLKDMTKTNIVNEVSAKLSADDVRPLTDKVTVTLAEKIEYKLYAKYSGTSTTNESELNAAIEEYVAWQNGSIGIPFNPDRLMALLYNAGASRVTWGSNSVFNGSSTIQYTSVASSKYCSGSVVLEKI